MPFTFLTPFSSYLALIWQLVLLTWWAWVPVVLFFAARRVWLDYFVVRYFSKLRWIQLEVRIPREVAKPPQAMEQIFATLHAALKFRDFYDTYWLGVQTDHFSFEVASVAGIVHFFVTIPEQYRNFVEAQIYAQYPESEVIEVSDYLDVLPANLPNDDYNLFGTEFILARPDGYPIRTYKEFVLEGVQIKEEERKVDPIAAIVEVLGKTKTTEYISMQLLIRPVGDEWQKDGEQLMNKLLGRASVAEPTFFDTITGFFGDTLGVLFSPGGEEKSVPAKPEKEKMPGPMDRKAAEAIQEDISKIGFYTVLRFLYVAKREDFTMMKFAAMNGALRQFNTQHLNSFRPNTKAMTNAKWYNPFKNRTKFKRQKLFYQAFKARARLDARILKSKPFIFNIEELATVYHYPGVTVAAPRMQRIEAKTSAPPINLPTE